ncbi:DUF3859 domain-containing protein [Pseudomonas sp. EL_65y_Pfl2_R95]|uniref:DUF3859 domain-containing protein n=1 Tax=Pseudomonas sp. EL_65y_Pfl2_R95 TaxID=3088698 RepID=UPI0030DD3EEF
MYSTRIGAVVALTVMASLVQAEVRVEGPVEYGVFATQYKDFKPGERVLTRSNQEIEITDSVPAKLGTKFGMRYKLAGKAAESEPLTLLYLTPGVQSPDGKRHDKFVVTQKMVPGAPMDTMAFEFTEPYEIVPGQWQFLVFQGDRKLAEQTFTVR